MVRIFCFRKFHKLSVLATKAEEQKTIKTQSDVKSSIYKSFPLIKPDKFPHILPPLFGVCSRKAPFIQANTEQSPNKPRTNLKKCCTLNDKSALYLILKAVDNYLKKSNPFDIQKKQSYSLFLKIRLIIITIVILIPH